MKDELKRYIGSQRKALVAVSAESIPVEDLNSGESSRVCGYFRMEVLGKVDGEHVNQFIKKNADGDIVHFSKKIFRVLFYPADFHAVFSGCYRIRTNNLFYYFTININPKSHVQKFLS